MVKNTNRNQASLSWQLIFPKIAEKTKWKQYIVWTTNFSISPTVGGCELGGLDEGDLS